MRLTIVLTALLAAMATKARSLRTVEQRTPQMANTDGGALGIGQRIADNTFGKVLYRLFFSQCWWCRSPYCSSVSQPADAGPLPSRCPCLRRGYHAGLPAVHA